MSDAPEKRSAAARTQDRARILAAMRQAVREALLVHKKMGNPIPILRDGEVVWLPPEEIPTEFDDESE